MATKTEERDVLVCIPMKASQIEGARAMSHALAEFPTIAWNYANRFRELLSGDDASAEQVGKEFGLLIPGLLADAERAHAAAAGLWPMVESATIADPKGQQGETLQ